MTIPRAWTPTELERKCLQHLDAPGSWKLLKADQPTITDILSWTPFRRIFAFNFVLFAVVLTAIFFGLESVGGTESSDLRADLPYGLGIAAILAVGFSAYTVHMYRHSWNGRARSLRLQESQLN